MLSLPLIPAAVLVLLVVLFDWFVRLERRGDRHTIFLVVMGVLLLEVLLAGEAARTPFGLLRPAFGPVDFRLPDVALLAMLGARLLSRPRNALRIADGLLAWIAFGAWYLTAFVVGRFGGEPLEPALYQGKVVFYVLGGMVAAGGADPERLARVLRVPAAVLAGAVVLNGLVQQLGAKIRLNMPLQSIAAVGRLGNDTVTLLTVVGATVLLCESMRPRRRIAVLASGAVLLAAPVSGQQRASYAVAAVIVVGLLAAVVGRTWRSRSTVRPLDLLFSVAALVLVAVGLSLAGVVGSPGAVVSERLDAAFAGEGEAESAAARITIAQAALSDVAARPVFGWGLGHRVTVRPSDATATKTLAAHNVVLDVSLRAGLVGLVLLVAAASKTVVVGVRRWRSEPSPTAAVCLGATLGIVAVFAKAMLEPALEWYRLSSLLGVCCGLVLIAGRRPALPHEAGDAGSGRPVSSLDAGGLRR